MGLSAQVIAVGPFSLRAISGLEYPAAYYDGVSEGTPVITNIFVTEGDKAVSRRLAEAFNVGPWELGKHRLNASNANVALIRELFGDKNTEQFLLLAANGFEFYYLPNG